MATEKWTPGATAGSWATALNAADFNSLALGSAVLSTVADIANATNLDEFCVVSIALGSAAFVAPDYIGVFFFPLNQDGTTYGDGQFASGTQTAKTPSAQYWKGNIIIPIATAAAVGSTPVFKLPPLAGRFVLYNQAGVALAASANACRYQTFNRVIV